ncbi:sulfotransferase [Arhodomonas sp. AD133]|uniref:sulfotransferase n=1 Tax=Arhodomonas sp. AD133 TaxID=3415009 RepID=UPI003EB8D954
MNATIPPVILIGMHRSGTSLVTRMLHDLGLFTGWRKDINHEPWYFLRLNDWLLHQCGGAWDNAEPFRHLRDSAMARRVTLGYLRFMLRAPRRVLYLGPREFLRHGDVSALQRPWGWKDPRNTYTLPLWRELYPQARVIHVYRHGVDVAASLQRRQTESVAHAERRFHRRRWLYGFIGKKGGFAESWRCADLDEALSLWREYTAEARRQVGECGELATEVRYETLLEDPAPVLERLGEFCGLSPSADQFERAVARVRSSRAFAHQRDPSLRELAERRRDDLHAFGY